MKNYLHFCFLMCFLILFSCNKNNGLDCTLPRNSFVYIIPYQYIPRDVDQVLVKTPIKFYSFTSIIIDSGRLDTFFRGSDISVFNLPLNPHKNISIFALFVDSTSSYPDTLKVYHQNSTTYISQACGFGSNFIIDSLQLVPYQIDSANILTPNVSIGSFKNNVEIILH